MASADDTARPLRNPPISEAVVDIRVRPDKPIDLAGFNNTFTEVRNEYPSRHERFAMQSGFSIRNQKGEVPNITIEQPSAKVDGVVFKSGDGRQLVQMRLDGFTFHRLRPYQHWDPFRDEANRLWQLYRQHVHGGRVVRIALRYINRIELPLPFEDFKEYILTTPEIAPGAPQSLAEFFMRLVIPHPEGKSFAIITETIQQPDEIKVPLIFDIDTFQAGVWELGDNSIWTVLEALRNFKNDLFFKSITRKTREMLDRE